MCITILWKAWNIARNYIYRVKPNASGKIKKDDQRQAKVKLQQLAKWAIFLHPTTEDSPLFPVLSHFWLETHVKDDGKEELIDDIGDINMCLDVRETYDGLKDLNDLIERAKNRFFVDQKKKLKRIFSHSLWN